MARPAALPCSVTVSHSIWLFLQASSDRLRCLRLRPGAQVQAGSVGDGSCRTANTLLWYLGYSSVHSCCWATLIKCCQRSLWSAAAAAAMIVSKSNYYILFWISHVQSYPKRGEFVQQAELIYSRREQLHFCLVTDHSASFLMRTALSLHRSCCVKYQLELFSYFYPSAQRLIGFVLTLMGAMHSHYPPCFPPVVFRTIKREACLFLYTQQQI